MIYLLTNFFVFFSLFLVAAILAWSLSKAETASSTKDFGMRVLNFVSSLVTILNGSSPASTALKPKKMLKISLFLQEILH